LLIIKLFRSRNVFILEYSAKQKKKNKKKMVPDREDADLDDKEHAPAAETENNEKPTNEV